MDLKNRVKTYAFWVALSSAVVVLVESFGKLLGFHIESTTIENVIMSICGVLIVLGIVTNSDSGTGSDTNSNDQLDTNNETHSDDSNKTE